MEERRSTRPGHESDQQNANSIAGRCQECTNQLIPPSDDLHEVASYDVRCSSEVMWHFPREPWWWQEEGADGLRAEVVDSFQVSDLSKLILELSSLPESSSVTSDEVAAIVRRQLCLVWKIDVARRWLAFQDKADPSECAYWRLQIEACSFLAENVWRFITVLPSALVADGLTAATARPFEIEPAEG